MSSQPSERVAILATIDPDANTATAYTSDWADMTAFHSMLAICQTGILGASATVDFKLQQATDSSGSGNKDITGKSVTQLVKASNDDDQVVINVRSDDMDVAGNFTHVAMVMTVAVATSDTSAILLGLDPRQGNAANVDLASVVEIIA